MPRGIPGSGPYGKARPRRRKGTSSGAGGPAGKGWNRRRRRFTKRQPQDFRFEVTDSGLRVQVGKYMIQISELLKSAGVSDEDLE